MLRVQRTAIAAISVVVLLLGGFSGTGHALETTIDFEAVAPGIYPTLTLSGFQFQILTGRPLQIVDLSPFNHGLSKAITAADLANPAGYDKSWGIQVTRTDGGTLGLLSADVEGWEDTAGHPQASAFGRGACDAFTCVAGDRVTDSMLGYEDIGPVGNANATTQFITSSGVSFPGGAGSPGFVFFDNYRIVTPDVSAPEPTSLLLVGAGLAGLAGLTWSRARRK